MVPHPSSLLLSASPAFPFLGHQDGPCFQLSPGATGCILFTDEGMHLPPGFLPPSQLAWVRDCGSSRVARASSHALWGGQGKRKSHKEGIPKPCPPFWITLLPEFRPNPEVGSGSRELAGTEPTGSLQHRSGRPVLFCRLFPD